MLESQTLIRSASVDYPSSKNWLEKLTAPFSVKPKIRAGKSGLVARSTFSQQLLSGFSYHKQLIVDGGTQTVQFKRRMFWFWHRQLEIPFARIKRIDYAFRDTGGDFFRAVIEFYTVSLVLVAPEETVALFTFIGEYSEPASVMDWLVHGGGALYWGSEGGQAVSSGEFVKLLQHFTGAPLV